MKYKAVHTVKLNMTPDEAWERLRDLSLASDYVPGVKSMEFLTDLKEGVGTQRRVYPQGIDEKVVLWIPGKEVTLELSKKGREAFFPFKKSAFRYSLSQTGETYMNLSLEYELILGSLGHLLFGGIIRKRIIRTAESLKKFYEN